MDLTAKLILVLSHQAGLYLFSHFQLVILNMLCLPMLPLSVSFVVQGRAQGWVNDSYTSGTWLTENDFGKCQLALVKLLLRKWIYFPHLNNKQFWNGPRLFFFFIFLLNEEVQCFGSKWYFIKYKVFLLLCILVIARIQFCLITGLLCSDCTKVQWQFLVASICNYIFVLGMT